MKAQVTHLTLDDQHRRLLAMRCGQLGISQSAYVATLIKRDAEQCGLTAFLAPTREEARRGKQ